MKILIWILRKLGIRATTENLTKSHVKSFIQAKVRKVQLSDSFKSVISLAGVDEFLGLPVHKQEQIIFRAALLENHSQGRICLKEDKCPCECTTSEVIISDDACDQKCFSAMLDEKAWEVEKKKLGILVDIVNQKVIKYVK